jgi:hypothetical protein
MGIKDVLDLSISVKDASVSKPSFAVSLLAAYHTKTGNVLDEVSSADELLELGSGFTTKDFVYRRAQKYFGQNPRPPKLVLGRRTLAYTKILKVWPLNTTQGFHYELDATGVDGETEEIDYAVPAGASKASVAKELSKRFFDYYFTVTAEADDNTFTLANHGFEAGTAVKFKNTGGALPTGLTQGTVYYVIEDGLTSGAFRVSATVDGTELNITTDGTGTNSVARDVSDVVGVSASYSGTDEFFTLTADDPGTIFELSNLPKVKHLKVEDITEDPGIATDLAAFYEDDPLSWYAILLDSESREEIEAAAGWVEASDGRKLLLVSTNDSEVVDASVTDDVGSTLKAALYARTAPLVYTRSSFGHLAAAAAGRMLPVTPGKATWDHKSLSGITFDQISNAQETAARNKNVGVYIQVGGKNWLRNVRTSSGEFLDTTIFVDWLFAELTAAVISAFHVNDKIGFTPEGLQLIDLTIRGPLERGKKNGGLLSYTTTLPVLADIPDDEKAARLLSGVTFHGVLQGAIHKLQITGSVSP